MAVKASSSPLLVASQRLKETKENVTQQLKVAEERIKSLCLQKEQVISRLTEECDLVEQEVESAKKKLEEKKVAIIEQLKQKRNEELCSLSESIEMVNVVVSKTAKVIDVANDLEREIDQARFFSAYSATNNSLEERFVDLLLSMDNQKCGHIEDKYSIDLSGIVEDLKTVTIKRCEDDVTYEEDLPKYQQENKHVISSLVNDDSDEVLADVPLDEAGAIDPGDPPISALQILPDTVMSVYVTGVKSPQNFTVQPLGTELISLMEDMGDHYLSGCPEVIDTPNVGDFYCAQFSEDECWYRAKIVEIIEDGNIQQVKVNYVDYGNEETLPLSELQPLDSKFRVLPCQAIPCCLKNTRPFSPSMGVWSSHICDWFSSLLLGRTIEVLICKCGPDRISLEILLLQEELQKSILPNVIQDNDFVDEQSSIPLSSFMDSIRLSAKSYDRNGGVSQVSSLPPLLIKLDAAREFTCLMSHVTDGLHFYVHPVQEDLAHTMSLITDLLQDHYSAEGNRVQLSLESIKCGNVCCVYSTESQHWCRGVVTSIKTDLSDGVLKCLIFHLDYGTSEWMESSKVFTLIEPLCGYPSQVVCCNFEEVTINCGIEKANKVLINPDIKGFVNDAYNCSITRGEILSECVNFMRISTERKQLFVIIRGSGLDCEDVLLVQDIGCVLPVDLYDTSGEYDIHLNKEVVDTQTQLLSRKTKTSSVIDDSNTSANLQQWNPMEDDYLSKRNIYKIDDSDAGLALEGYKSTSRICKFYTSGEHCFRGSECKFLHLQQGVSNKQIEPAVVNSSNLLKLPKKGDWVVAIVTAVISPTRFYVQLPLGCKSPLALNQPGDELVNEEDLEDFFSMLEEMRDYYNKQVFDQRDVILPHTGEVVAAHDEEDGYWYRARVIDSSYDSLTVFFVDYGNMSTLLDVNIRSLKPKFMVVPFQAVECFFPDMQTSPMYLASPQQARETFTDFIQNKVLVAKVISVEANGSLGLELYSNTEDDMTDVNINKGLVESGVLRKQTLKKVTCVKDDCISMRPG